MRAHIGKTAARTNKMATNQNQKEECTSLGSISYNPIRYPHMGKNHGKKNIGEHCKAYKKRL